MIALLSISANTTGRVSGWSLLAIGPVQFDHVSDDLFAGLRRLGPRAAEGSGIICVAIVGGAIVPLITGHAADWVGLKTALMVPAICYAGILSFGIYARRPKDA